MNVHLVLVHGDFIRPQVPDQPSNPCQPPHFALFWPWATHNGLGTTQPDAMPFQQPTHRRHAHGDSSPCREHSDQKFLRPCRPQVTVISGRSGQHGQQFQLVKLRDLVLAVVLAPIRQPLGSLVYEAMGDSIDLGRGTQAAFLDRCRRLTLDQGDDQFATTAQDGIRRSSAQGLHNPPLSLPESSPNDEDFCTKTHEELLSLACWPAQRKCLELLIFLSLPESRKAIYYVLGQVAHIFRRQFLPADRLHQLPAMV